ncbi:MAG: beta-ketoacyl-ACP synthase III [Candidatus Zipacnadales bacterium]
MAAHIISAKIWGLGSYLPDRILTNAELEARAELNTSDEWIVRRTGIRERHLAAEDQATSDLCNRAAQACLADAGVSPEQIDLIIVATVTPDMMFPATACLVQRDLGATNAAAFDLVLGCTGFVAGLATGAQFIATRACKHVLVIGADTLSRITDWQDRSTCVLFGDGAGAVLLGPGEPGTGLLSFSMVNNGHASDLLTLPAGGSREPVSVETIQARRHFIHMEGKELFRLAVEGIPIVAEAALRKAGLRPADIDHLVMHQANVRIIEAAAKRLRLSEEKVVVTIDRHGNTSAASMPLALDVLRAQGRLSAGDLVLLVGFGAGFALAAAVVRW